MNGLYRTLIRPLLFSQESEEIHDRTLRGLGFCARQHLMIEALDAILGSPPLPVDLFGLRFPNPVGLARSEERRVGKEC